MPKYWGKQIFSLGSFPEVGQKQKTEKKKKIEERKLVITMLRIANATSCGAHKAAWVKIINQDPTYQNIKGDKKRMCTPNTTKQI